MKPPRHTSRIQVSFLSPLADGHKIDLGVGEAEVYPNEVPRAANSITKEAACNECGEQASSPG